MVLSIIILTKNEERDIKDCIECVENLGDEIIVVDDDSTDRTAEIAKSLKATVYSRSLEDFSSQRNFGLEKANSEWVFFLDADERVSPGLIREIKEAIKSNNVNGYYVQRRDVMWGRELKNGEWGNQKILRLAKKEFSLGWTGKVHEVWKIKGQTNTLSEFLLHYPHKTINEFLKDLNKYTDMRAEELFKNGKTANWISIILYTKVKFFQNYIFKLGIRDGVPGLVLSLIMSFHSFLVRGKLWQLNKNKIS